MKLKNKFFKKQKPNEHPNQLIIYSIEYGNTYIFPVGDLKVNENDIFFYKENSDTDEAFPIKIKSIETNDDGSKRYYSIETDIFEEKIKNKLTQNEKNDYGLD